jgi:hypothetical protein
VRQWRLRLLIPESFPWHVQPPQLLRFVLRLQLQLQQLRLVRLQQLRLQLWLRLAPPSLGRLLVQLLQLLRFGLLQLL